MNALLEGLVETFYPRRNVRHGPLPSLLVVLTIVTGLVDAFSYLVLGHVFVANMTGNVVFLGFALAGAPGFSISASLAAVAAFVVGAALGGRLYAKKPVHRGLLLARTSTLQATLLLASALVAAQTSYHTSAGYRYTLIALLGIAMGLQNSAARKLAVPDLTTTVLTLTITGMIADVGDVKGLTAINERRLIAVLSMFIGGLVGAVLVLHADIFAPLLIATVGVTAVDCVAWRASRSESAWHSA
jgi:uncharacterized membrane protein YoaK (UPF0700 family)